MDDSVSPIVGGRNAALRLLDDVRPAEYRLSRQYLDGAVTGLSPYVRHGVVSLAEVKQAVLARAPGAEGAKLLQGLAWRDYYRRVFAAVGDDIWRDLECYKTGFCGTEYSDAVPADVQAAKTGIDWVDTFARELHATGWLHNHARMWLAAYVVHVRRVRWQAGARWFMTHLLDGDPASNNLSWQWVASTFSNKPYIFNRESLVDFSGRRFPQHSSRDPLDATLEDIHAKLFATPTTDGVVYGAADVLKNVMPLDFTPPPSMPVTPTPLPAVAWIHADALRESHPAYAGTAARLFVWDDAQIQEQSWSLKRAVFVREALNDIERLTIWTGDPVRDLLTFAIAHNAKRVVVPASPDPYVRSVVDKLRSQIHVDVVDEEPFVRLDGPLDLRRFSRYWPAVEQALELA